MDDQLSRVFSALADPTRRDMVARLTAADATVNELAEPYDVSVQAVSKHLKVLEEAGLVSRSREAQRRPVHLEAEVFDLMTKWIERYRRRAEERYRRLDDVLAEMDTDSRPPTRQRTRSFLMNTTHRARRRSRRTRRPDHHHHPRVRRPARARLPRPRRARARAALAGPARAGDGHRPLRLRDRRGLPVHPPGRERRVPASTARSTRSGRTSGSSRPSPSRASPTASASRR